MPCFNEEQGIAETLSVVMKKLYALAEQKLIAPSSAMLFSDDGSKDNTWKIIQEAHLAHPDKVKAVHLASNRGKEYALWAGVMEARKHADIVIVMDADLQFDIEAVERFLELHRQGYDLVYGIKNNRAKESFIKRITAAVFYGVMKRLGSPLIPNHSDYTLMTKQVCDALSEYGESNIMFRAIAKSLGFKQTPCYFDVKNRMNGSSKFSLMSLFNLGMDALTSFSVVPLRLIGLIGWLVLFVGLVQIVWTCVDYFMGNPPGGYATLLCSIWFLGGMGTICMSIIGEYMGKMYMETKKRPRYYIDKILS